MLKITSGAIAAIFLILAVLACDSPPWSRFIVANNSDTEITVRFYTPYVSMASPYLYTPEEWSADQHFYSGTPKEKFIINKTENYVEVQLVPGSAVEIDRARYPDVEENVEQNFLIDRLDIDGSSGPRSWVGRQEVFNQLQKEGGGALWYVRGKSPRYVYYYR